MYSKTETVFGPNRELNEKARDKIFKCYTGNGFIIKVPVDIKNVPEEEMKFINSQSHATTK